MACFYYNSPYYLCIVKKLVVVIALLFLSKPIIPVFDYVINYDYIVKELCENKEKPELQCNGKCQLMKEMAKAAEAETATEKSNSTEKKTAQSTIEILFFEEINAFETNNNFSSSKNCSFTFYSNLYSSTNSFAFFHPPIVIS